MIEVVGIVCTVIAVAGVVLNNRKMRECFWLWMVSNLISAGLHVWLGLWSLAVRDAIFFVLAIEGVWMWKKNFGTEKKKSNVCECGGIVFTREDGPWRCRDCGRKAAF